MKETKSLKVKKQKARAKNRALFSFSLGEFENINI